MAYTAYGGDTMGRNSVACVRFYGSGRRSKRASFFLKLLSIIIVLGLIVSYSEYRVKPYLREISENLVRDVVNSTVNSAARGGFNIGARYEDLVMITRNDEGRIVNIQTDVEKMNRIAAGVSDDIREKLNNLAKDTIKIPLGVLTGTALFAGMGPDLNIRFRPYGNVHTEFVSEFRSMGNNRTKHTISLVTHTTVLVAFPPLSEKYEFTTSVPVAEAILFEEPVNKSTG